MAITQSSGGQPSSSSGCGPSKHQTPPPPLRLSPLHLETSESGPVTASVPVSRQHYTREQSPLHVRHGLRMEEALLPTLLIDTPRHPTRFDTRAPGSRPRLPVYPPSTRSLDPGKRLTSGNVAHCNRTTQTAMGIHVDPDHPQRRMSRISSALQPTLLPNLLLTSNRAALPLPSHLAASSAMPTQSSPLPVIWSSNHNAPTATSTQAKQILLPLQTCRSPFIPRQFPRHMSSQPPP